MLRSPPPRSLSLNMLYAIAGTGLLQASQFAVVILLAKFASAEILGQFTQSLALAAPVVFFFGFELRGALVADVRNQFTYGTYAALRLVGMAAAGVVLAGLIGWQALTQPDPGYLLILAGVVSGRLIFSISEVRWGVFQRCERLDLLAGATGLRGLALLLPFAVLVPLYDWLTQRGSVAPQHLRDGTILAVAGHVVGWLLAARSYDRPRLARVADLDASWNWPAVRALARQTFPLGVVALIIALCDSLPRLWIEAQPDGDRRLGHFSALTYIPLVGNLVMIQAASAAANRLSGYYATDRRAHLRLVGRLSLLALAIGVLLFAAVGAFGPEILRIVYRPEYAPYQAEFRIIVLAGGLSLLTNVFGIATTQMRLFWLQVPVQTIVLAATALTAWWTIPANPVLGGAWTVLVRAAVQLALYAGCVGVGLLGRGKAVMSDE